MISMPSLSCQACCVVNCDCPSLHETEGTDDKTAEHQMSHTGSYKMNTRFILRYDLAHALRDLI
jgi:hypothetical protein